MKKTLDVTSLPSAATTLMPYITHLCSFFVWYMLLNEFCKVLNDSKPVVQLGNAL